MKKYKTLLVLVLACVQLSAQIVNNSFEQNNQPTLDGWADLCNFGTSEQDAPPEGGLWSLKMQPGQTQGCYPGYFYQVLPNVTDGQIFLFTGWAKTIQGEPVVGIYLAKIDLEGTISLFEGETTNEQEWTMLSTQDTFHLEVGEVAAVLINSGLVGGPVGPSHSSFFDEFHLDMITSQHEPDAMELRIFPNPVERSMIKVETNLNPARVLATSVFDSVGRKVFSRPGYEHSIEVDSWKPGIYILLIETQKGKLTERIVKL